jgi:hypothetical protein
MTEQHRDPDYGSFLKEFTELMRRYPEASRRYQLKTVDLELEMGIDLEKEVGVARIEGRKIVIEFVDRAVFAQRFAETSDGGTPDGGTACKVWDCRDNGRIPRCQCVVLQT